MSETDRAFILGVLAGGPLALLGLCLLLAVAFYLTSALEARRHRARDEKLARYFPPREVP